MEVAEQALVEQAASGDEAAFEALVRRHWPAVSRLARSIVGEAEAEDAAQDGFVTAWQKIRSLRDSSAFESWLRRIVVRQCLGRARRPVVARSLELLFGRPAAAPDLDGDLDVERLLKSLAPRQRAVLHMTVVLGMTDREIGAALDVTAATVRAHRRRARQVLTRRLPPAEGRALRLNPN